MLSEKKHQLRVEFLRWSYQAYGRGSDEKYEDLFAPYEIQDTMITEAVKEGIPLYNFYGVSGKFDGSDGVLGFKTHFNGYTREMVGSFDFPVQKTKYYFYRLFKKILHRQ